MTSLATEIRKAVDRVLASGHYILGPEVDRFERAFSSVAGTEHCTGVASGTDAVALALQGCGVGSGDVVVCPSHTAVATVAAIDSIGGVPAFVDVTDDHTMDPGSLDAAIAELRAAGLSARAIVAVHLYGLPADMGPIRSIADDNGLLLIEDAAQAHGASVDGQPVGSLGHAAAFSFYPTKNLGALGDGGAITTSDRAVDERVRALRQYGWTTRYVSDTPGRNSRLDEMQAAILSELLPMLDAWNLQRRAVAEAYVDGLEGSQTISPPTPPANRRHVYHQYVVRSPSRDRLAAHLGAAGIGTAVLYPVPVHLQPAYVEHALRPVSLARTEEMASEILCLPIGPHVSPEDATEIAKEILRFEEG